MNLTRSIVVCTFSANAKLKYCGICGCFHALPSFRLRSYEKVFSSSCGLSYEKRISSGHNDSATWLVLVRAGRHSTRRRCFAMWKHHAHLHSYGDKTGIMQSGLPFARQATLPVLLLGNAFKMIQVCQSRKPQTISKKHYMILIFQATHEQLGFLFQPNRRRKNHASPSSAITCAAMLSPSLGHPQGPELTMHLPSLGLPLGPTLAMHPPSLGLAMGSQLTMHLPWLSLPDRLLVAGLFNLILAHT